MQLGELIRILRAADTNSHVRYDFAGCVPTRVGSWRGVYSEPALGWIATGYSGVGIHKNVTVGNLLMELEEALNTEHEGWKGGGFRYTEDSPLHIDNPGDWTSTEIDHVTVDGLELVIHTVRDRDYL